MEFTNNISLIRSVSNSLKEAAGNGIMPERKIVHGTDLQQ
jgi:hypothetical protein